MENRVYFQFSTAENAVPTLSIKLNCNNPGPKWFLALEGSKQVSIVTPLEPSVCSTVPSCSKLLLAVII